MNNKTIINVWQNVLSKEEVARLNGPNGGWDSEARFARYADLQTFAKPVMAEAAFRHGDHTLVASVETDGGLEDAFRLTQHGLVEESWQFNNGVTAIGEARTRARSSMTGDIFEKIENGRSTFHVVAMVGFKLIAGLGPHMHGELAEKEQA